MGWMIVGFVCGIIALGGLFIPGSSGGSFIGLLFWGTIGYFSFRKGYRPWAAENARQAAELAAIKAQEAREMREAGERANEVRRQERESRQQREDFENTQRQIASSAGRDNLRRYVNELLEYAVGLRAGTDNSSTFNGMTDTLSRLAADTSIDEAEKANPKIQRDVDDVLGHLEDVGPSSTRIANRVRDYLKVTPVAVIPPSKPAVTTSVQRLLQRQYGDDPDEPSNWN